MNWLYGLPVAIASLFAMRPLVHWFQLESYQFPGYFRTIRRNMPRAALPGLVLAVASLVLLLCSQVYHSVLVRLLVLAVLLPIGMQCAQLAENRQAKKPLVYTARVKRLCVVSGLLFAFLCILLSLPGWLPLSFFPLLLPLWTALAGLLAWPVEKLISTLYLNSAKKKLRSRPDLLRIGITGSYGKTSVKFILATLLEERFQVLATPGSFNTPMGLTRVIREKLEPSHQIFLAEMGARHRRDIKDLCRLVHPQMGVLTSVGPQHLDTFGSLEKIIETKYDLMRAVPSDGACFFPDDGDICTGLWRRTEGKEKHLAGLKQAEGVEIWAEDVQVSSEGSAFMLCTAGERIACHTKLLGAHNIQNILLASAVCRKLGMSLKQISRGITRLEPVAHRLQLIPAAGGITMIDDAFNSNPMGAARALGVLKQFAGRRIIVTPGMVELGEKEADYNRTFGTQMKDCVDLAVLVGAKHTQPIAEGMRSAGFAKEQILSVGSLDEALAKLREISKPGDVILFENDLPDNYSEMK